MNAPINSRPGQFEPLTRKQANERKLEVMRMQITEVITAPGHNFNNTDMRDAINALIEQARITGRATK
tara:strand:+ start:596 stop:799 length:204 start_codon:yes stop_codon:yes gene_type:complete